MAERVNIKADHKLIVRHRLGGCGHGLSNNWDLARSINSRRG